jgi:uncharacterized protein (TIGR02996 family)
MSSEEDFIKHLESNPKDYFFRMIYSDWLEENDRIDDANRQRSYQYADEWMDKFCKDRYLGSYDDIDHYGREITRDEIVSLAKEVALTGGDFNDYITQIGREDLRDDYYRSEEEFWDVIYILTGVRAKKERGYYPSIFSCSC